MCWSDAAIVSLDDDDEAAADGSTIPASSSIEPMASELEIEHESRISSISTSSVNCKSSTSTLLPTATPNVTSEVPSPSKLESDVSLSYGPAACTQSLSRLVGLLGR